VHHDSVFCVCTLFFHLPFLLFLPHAYFLRIFPLIIPRHPFGGLYIWRAIYIWRDISIWRALSVLRALMWQSSRKLTPSALEQDATPILSDQVQAQRQQQRLHTLSANNRPIDTIPDGACPSALPLLLTRLGTYQVDYNNIIHELIRSTLSNTFNLAEVHKTWKVHHLQLLGIPLIGLGTIPNKTTSTCHLCDMAAHVLDTC
jgi:hypothetical protein